MQDLGDYIYARNKSRLPPRHDGTTPMNLHRNRGNGRRSLDSHPGHGVLPGCRGYVGHDSGLLTMDNFVCCLHRTDHQQCHTGCWYRWQTFNPLLRVQFQVGADLRIRGGNYCEFLHFHSATRLTANITIHGLQLAWPAYRTRTFNGDSEARKRFNVIGARLLPRASPSFRRSGHEHKRYSDGQIS